MKGVSRNQVPSVSAWPIALLAVPRTTRRRIRLSFVVLVATCLLQPECQPPKQHHPKRAAVRDVGAGRTTTCEPRHRASFASAYTDRVRLYTWRRTRRVRGHSPNAAAESHVRRAR